MRSLQKNIALINDLSGFGRCSLTVSLPILSAMGIQCDVLPTCVLSNHTAYPTYTFRDLTEDMDEYAREWKKLNLEFQGIYTGFLGSDLQIEKVENFISDFKTPQTQIIVDPVMGDNGKIYPTYTEEMCRKMKSLVQKASIITPNLTEACQLLEIDYKEDFSKEEMEGILEMLLKMGPSKVVISGIETENTVSNCALEKGKEAVWIEMEKVFPFRHGTGDVFASIIAGDALLNIDFYQSVEQAAGFVRDCLVLSNEMKVPLEDGVCFELLLDRLTKKNSAL